jgi:hypothetical protein
VTIILQLWVLFKLFVIRSPFLHLTIFLIHFKVYVLCLVVRKLLISAICAFSSCYMAIPKRCVIFAFSTLIFFLSFPSMTNIIDRWLHFDWYEHCVCEYPGHNTETRKRNSTSYFENHDRPKGNIVTHMTIARQRFGKYIPNITQSTVEGPPLLGSKSLGTCHGNGQNIDNNRRTVRGGGLLPRVIKESSFVNSFGFIRKSSWVFICGVLTSGQRKLKKLPIRKSEPRQSQRKRRHS